MLETAYDELRFRSDGLIRPAEAPAPTGDDAWEQLGDWLTLGARVGADRLFFVGGDPVVVFKNLPGEASDADIVSAYRKAWSLGRARCLFLASDDLLRVYALSAPPPRSSREVDQLAPLEIVTRTADVAETLARFSRERFESGLLLEEDPFRSAERADDLLLRDVAVATDALEGAGLPKRLAHELIERVILIRYMEDRGILLPAYFEEIATRQPGWLEAFRRPAEAASFGTQSTFLRCLGSHGLTDALFSRLAEDFNGDLFVRTAEELELVTDEHLNLVKRLLSGEGFQAQAPLFLWAYDFSVVPTGLISSMYERFYRSDATDDDGTHYTPQELVEFVASEVLTPTVLAGAGRVCDPACGSGIFLVEAYRRIVRHEMASQGRGLSSAELRTLLLNRIVGIDINREAIRLAAFSLYLAYLGYQSPPDIRRSGPLPNLIAGTDMGGPPVLYAADAFSAVPAGPGQQVQTLSDSLQPAITRLPIDVIIGNPPWNEPRRGPASAAERWAAGHQLPIGDRSPSQLFLWLSTFMIEPGGSVALLVSSKTFHNSRRTSREFRSAWLDAVDLVSVTDFSSVRRTFFSGAVAPFALVVFRRRSKPATSGGPRRSLLFRSVRPGVALRASRSLAFASADRRWVSQEALRAKDYLWKVYGWGSHLDAALMARLELEKRIEDFLPGEPKPGYGYQYGRDVPSEELQHLRSITSSFVPWGSLEDAWFEPAPLGVKRQPDARLYTGQRILVGGLAPGFGPKSRLVTESMSFRHTIYCLPLHNLQDWEAKIVWATLLSSLGRYSIFMRSGSWGTWHDSVRAGTVLQTPLRLPGRETSVTRTIVDAVDALAVEPDEPDGGRSAVWASAQAAIDGAIFDLFDASERERALVTDFHRYLLPLAGGRADDLGSTRMTFAAPSQGDDIDAPQLGGELMRSYVAAFLDMWRPYLEPSRVGLSCQVECASGRDLVAAVFETFAGEAAPLRIGGGSGWSDALDRLADTQLRADRGPLGGGVIRSVSDTSIVVIKPNRMRFWSASAAMEDAEATLRQAINLTA